MNQSIVGSRLQRMFPLVQVMSSTKLCTGTLNRVVVFSAVSGLMPAKSENELFPAPMLFSA